MKLSVIIPSWKDPLLIKTIGSLLTSSELGDQLEIIGVLDGYWPEFKLIGDPRVRYVHLGKNRGMRGAINAGVDIARGEFIMRTDEHCMFAQGFDRIMTENCRSNWIMTASRYFLDPIKWEVIEDQPPVGYEKLVIQGEEGGVQKFAGQRWRSRDKGRTHRKLDETMAMQGSVWVMPRKWWNEVMGELQTEGYGPLIQDSHEMSFKTWKAGGHLILNKRTWFAHKHRSFSRTHNNGTEENPANCGAGYIYALEVWRDYYETEIRKRWGI
jgi:glycosyltransferase involved in cell wall biosynthesis